MSPCVVPGRMVQLLPGASPLDHGGHHHGSFHGGQHGHGHGGGGHRAMLSSEIRGNHLYGSRPHMSSSSSYAMDQFRSRGPQGGGGVSPHNELFDTPFCPKHAPENRESQGWAEKENGTLLPIVCIGLATLGTNLKSIIKVIQSQFLQLRVLLRL